jgi:hypothetical protein
MATPPFATTDLSWGVDAFNLTHWRVSVAGEAMAVNENSENEIMKSLVSRSMATSRQKFNTPGWLTEGGEN